MSNWNRITDGTANPPRLEMQQALWAMDGLGVNGQEWSLEEKFAKIAEAGFTGVSYFIPAAEDMAEWHRLLDCYKLNFAALSFPANSTDMLKTLQQAKEFGRVQHINSQVMDSFVIDQAAIRLLDDLLQVSEAANIPNFIETHRGRITQDLIRTVSYVEALPQLRLTIDLSHYVVAGEMTGTCEQAESYFDRLLERSASMHARVSNGEQVQIDVGMDGDHPMLEHYTRWWRKGMGHWLKQAQPGDLFPFCCELGPPPYAIIRRNAQGQEQEISDRWQQALLFKRIAEEQWEQALRSNS